MTATAPKSFVVCMARSHHLVAFDAAMRSAAHASTSAAFHAVELSDSLIGFGNLPALTHAQTLEPDT